MKNFFRGPSHRAMILTVTVNTVMWPWTVLAALPLFTPEDLLDRVDDWLDRVTSMDNS